MQMFRRNNACKRIVNIRPGSILVFHDSLKAFKNLEYALPKTLIYLKENNFTCGVISNKITIVLERY
jgi:aminoglycoside N3'-acetyltransferase